MNIVNRVQKILLQPKAEWAVIDAEPATVGGLYAGYIVILSAIGAIASLVGMSLIGVSLPFAGNVRLPLASAVVSAVIRYALGLVGVFVLALIIDALAPTFGGQKNRIQALKVAAYSSTPAWVAGILGLIPALGVLVLLISLYGFYLLYLGLPILMKAPQDKAIGYTVLVVVFAIVLFFVVGLIAAVPLTLHRAINPLGA